MPEGLQADTPAAEVCPPVRGQPGSLLPVARPARGEPGAAGRRVGPLYRWACPGPPTTGSCGAWRRVGAWCGRRWVTGQRVTAPAQAVVVTFKPHHLELRHRLLTWTMIDEDVVYLPPPSVQRILREEGLRQAWERGQRGTRNKPPPSERVPAVGPAFLEGGGAKVLPPRVPGRFQPLRAGLGGSCAEWTGRAASPWLRSPPWKPCPRRIGSAPRSRGTTAAPLSAGAPAGCSTRKGWDAHGSTGRPGPHTRLQPPNCLLVGLNPSHREVLPGVNTLPQEGRPRGTEGGTRAARPTKCTWLPRDPEPPPAPTKRIRRTCVPTAGTDTGFRRAG